MEKSPDNDIENLTSNASFRKWALSPTESSGIVWKKWAGSSPERKSILEAARIIVITTHDGFRDDLTEQVIDSKIRTLMGRLSDTQQSETARKPISRQLLWLRGAAAVLLLAGLAWWFTKPGKQEPIVAANEKVLKKALEHAITKVNSSNSAETIVLSDSSVVTLAPGSRITFPSAFLSDRRVVSLVGNAFFEIAHKPEKPFLVCAGATVTRVVGTSFRIIAAQTAGRVTVQVRTGKVALFRSADFDLHTLLPLNGEEGLLLTTDQQATFFTTTKDLQKGKQLAVAPQPLNRVREQIFDDTPVSLVFRQMEEQYGTDIEFNEKIYARCPITTSFTDESLIERINTICQAVGAGYQLVDGQIIISGSGCQH